MSQEPTRRKTVYILFLVLLAGTLGFLIGNKAALERADLDRDSTWPTFIIIAVVILFASIIKDRWIERGIFRALEDMQAEIRDNKKDVQELIDKNLQPHIISLDTKKKVWTAATDIIEQLLNERDHRHREIVYVGSPSLSQAESSKDEEDETSPFAGYTNAVRRMMASHDISIKRYISLLDPVNFTKRTTPTQEQYRKWLEKQKMLVKDNPSYHIFDCPRAPSWGGSKTSMITHRAILDTVGSGTSGLRINGDQVAKEMIDSTENLFEAPVRQPKPIIYGVKELENYIRDLDDALAESRGQQGNTDKSKS